MILVDSSIWVDLLQKPASPGAQRLKRWMEEDLCTCGIVLQEVLQGIQDSALFLEIYNRLSLLPFLEPSRDTYLGASYLFRRCRRKGIQIHTVDALLMSLAIQRVVPVLTSDSDFERVASIEKGLRILR